MSYERLFQSEVNGDAVKAWQAQGKKALGVLCCHLPEEILYAADVLPVRMRATNCTEYDAAEMWMSSFSCTFAKSVLQYWIDGKYQLDGVVATDGCLMASRLYDNAEHINQTEGRGQFFQQIGAPRMANADTIPFFKAELEDLIAGLEKLTGNKITDEKLKAAVKKQNEARALIKEVYELRKAEHPVISGEDCLKLTMASCDIPVDEYIGLLKEFLADAKTRAPITDKRARLMVIGSALDDPGYLKVVEDQGAIVVCDMLCFGSRGYNDELVVDDSDVLGSIAKYYLTRLVCPRSMDNRAELHEHIIKTAQDYKVDGVLYEKMQYCECWGGESVLLEDELKAVGIPILTVEREEHLSNQGQLAIRAEAFVEMIEKED